MTLDWNLILHVLRGDDEVMVEILTSPHATKASKPE